MVVGFCLVLSWPPAVSGQGATRLTRAGPVQGTLEGGDPRLLEGHHFDAYTFDGRAGEAVVLSLESDEFDAFLGLALRAGVVTERIATNDDGPRGTDSQLARVLPADGEYVVVVRGLSSDALGHYALELRTLEHVAPTVVDIAPGQVRVGELGDEDDFTDEVAYYELYRFDAGAGERVSVTLRSSQLDTRVELGLWDGETFTSIGENDDGFEDGTTDSRLIRTVPEAGRYAIRATSYGPREVGQFTVELEALPPAEASPVRPIGAGETLSGQLTAVDTELEDGSYYDSYRYEGTPGERVTVTLRSRDFDAYLALGAPVGSGGFHPFAYDDDGASGTDAEATVTVPAGGVLLIRANSLAPGAEEDYSLTLQRAGS
jgi:hypothetical protein